MFIQIFINMLLLIELVADLIVFGPVKAYKQHFRAWPETICQIINATLVYQLMRDLYNDDIKNYTTMNKNFELIIFIRCLKLLVLMTEFNNLKIII